MQSSGYTRNCPACGKILSYKSSVSFKFAEKNNQKCKDCCERKNRLPKEMVEQILDLNGKGVLNREIARTLGIHHRTVNDCLKKNGKASNFANQPIDMVSNTEARCHKCKEIKSIDEFQWGRKGQKYEYKFSYCNVCRKKQVYLNLNNDVDKFLSDRYHRLMRRAKKNNIPCTITKEEFIAQYHKQEGLCFYTDTKMVCEVGSELHRDSLSVDKLIPEIGYCADNVVFTTHRINTCKCDLSLDEIRLWMPDWFYRIKIQELLNLIRKSSKLELVLSFNDIGIDERAKATKGGFDANANPPTIMVPTNEYVIGKLWKRLEAQKILFTLAHEFGHYQSFCDGYWSDELQELRTQNKEVRLAEEERAWNYARKILLSILKPFPVDQFEEIRKKSLNSYKNELAGIL